MNGKADVDLSNCTKPYVTATYVNETSWWRLWSDKWCEQGGFYANTANQGTVNLLKSYANTNYNVQLTILNAITGDSGSNIKVNSKSTSSFIAWVQTNERPIMWQASGYTS